MIMTNFKALPVTLSKHQNNQLNNEILFKVNLHILNNNRKIIKKVKKASNHAMQYLQKYRLT